MIIKLTVPPESITSLSTGLKFSRQLKAAGLTLGTDYNWSVESGSREVCFEIQDQYADIVSFSLLRW